MLEDFVVDDSRVNCEVIFDHIKQDGYSVDVCYSAKEVIAPLSQGAYHLILLDMMMPEMSGEELMTYLRKQESFKDIPIIAVTARASEEDKLNVLSFRADDYLAKPVHASELRLRVARLIERLSLEENKRKSKS